MGAGWAILAGYAALLLLLLPLQSLWLDELMEVVATAGLPLHDVVAGYAAHSAGQSPLGALEQAFSIRLLGFSAFAARLPAAIASILGCAGMLVLSRKAGVQRAWVALVLFASLPLVLRYGAEARPYSQALCIAVWLTVLFLDLLQGPALRSFTIYAALLAIGLYTQPFVLFVAAGQAFFLMVRKRWALLAPFSAVLVVATCAYLPWYFHSRGYWKQEIDAAQLHFHLQARLALLIPRELTGAGYVGALAVVLLAVYGIPCLRKEGSDWLLWGAMILAPVCLAILTDFVFDYFFAIRQVIFVLPPLAMAGAAGLERMYKERGARLAVTTATLLVALNTGYAIHWFTKPRENWAAAAQILKRSASSGGCFLALPSGSKVYYEFFQPTLKAYECTEADLRKRSAIALAVSPYLVDRESDIGTEGKLRAANFKLLDKTGSAQPQVRLYVREAEEH